MGLRSNPRTAQLSNLAKSYPATNAQTVKGLQEAQTTQLQKSLQQVNQTQQAPTQASIAQTAAQTAGANAQAANQVAAQGLQAQSQLAQGAIQEQGRARQEALLAKQNALAQTSRQNQDQLFNLAQGKKQELFDQNLKFQRDEMGRTFFNERQLADWAITKAKTREDLLNYEQKMGQQFQNRMQLLKHSQNLIVTQLQQEFAKDEQSRDQALTLKLTEAKAALDKKIADAQAESSSMAAIFQGVSTVAAATVGFMVLGPAGVAPAAALGGGLGSVAAGVSSSSKPVTR